MYTQNSERERFYHVVAPVYVHLLVFDDISFFMIGKTIWKVYSRLKEAEYKRCGDAVMLIYIFEKRGCGS
jgi:hypothetical protein